MWHELGDRTIDTHRLGIARSCTLTRLLVVNTIDRAHYIESRTSTCTLAHASRCVVTVASHKTMGHLGKRDGTQVENPATKALPTMLVCLILTGRQRPEDQDDIFSLARAIFSL